MTDDHTFTAIWNKIEEKEEPQGTPGETNGNIPYVQPVSTETKSDVEMKPAPLTGDFSQMGSYCAVLFLSGTSLVLLLWMRKREKARR